MDTGLKIGEFELFWLNGGIFALDGGAMFGVVPKVLWQKRYPADAENYIPLRAWPILVRTPKHLVLIETGIGNKLTDKQKKIYRVQEDWAIVGDLEALGSRREDIDHVILTHYDFDHAGGVLMQTSSGGTEITFPRARHIVQRPEWEDVTAPNIRNINTYWPINNELMRGSDVIDLVEGETEVVPGITAIQTGGHNRGHQIVRISSHGQTAYHLADLLPTHAHFNPLWIMAYDNFPMESIALKETWIRKGLEENAWFTFYHDAFFCACRFDEKGNVMEKWPAG